MKRVIKLRESDLHRIVYNAINEVVVGNPHDNLGAVNQAAGYFPDDTLDYMKRHQSYSSDLAELLVDNGLDAEVLNDYPAILKAVDINDVMVEMDKYRKFLESERRYEKSQEYKAWAEDRMAEMGMDDDSLA